MNMKIQLSLCVTLCLYYFSVAVSGSESKSKSSEPSKNSNPDEVSDSDPIEHLEGLVNYFKAAKDQNREQAKINEELKEQLKSLSDKFDKLKEEISSDHGLWLLTPPLRGPPGRPAEKGDLEQNGLAGEPGPKGEPGVSGSVSRPKSCAEIQRVSKLSGFKVRAIYPFGSNSSAVEVMCDFETDGGGWTIIQKREKGPKEEFYRNWTDYAKGFYGNQSEGASGNYWIGLDTIYALTNQNQSLRVDLTYWNDTAIFAEYSSFSISDSNTNYTLTVGGYSAKSSAIDSMEYHNRMRFSTRDRENDEDGSSSCAQQYKGAWWYKSCYMSSLNGLYLNPSVDVSADRYTGIQWTNVGSMSTLQKTTSMKIRDADFLNSLL